MRSHGCLRAIQFAGDFFGGQSLYVTKQQSRSLSRAQEPETVFEVLGLFGTKQNMFGAVVGGGAKGFADFIDVRKINAAVPA
jgi:hypothetical protein